MVSKHNTETEFETNIEHWATENIPGEGLDVFGGSKDGSSERGLLVCDGVQVIEDDLLQVHLNLLHLAKNHAPLALNFLLENERKVGFDSCSLMKFGKTKFWDKLKRQKV